MQVEEQEKEYKIKEDFLLLFFSVLLTIISLIISSVIISKFFRPIDQSAEILKLFALPLGDFKPEPLEKTLYFSLTLLTPILLFSWFFILKETIIKKIKNTNTLNVFFQKITLTSFILIFGLFLADFLQTPSYLTLLKNFLSTQMFAVLAALSLIFSTILVYKENLIPKKVIRIICTILIFMVFLTLPLMSIFSIYNLNEGSHFTIHFNSVFHSVSQVFLGKELFVDLTNQYGLFPHLINPIFQLIGLTVFKFSIVMALFIMISYYAFYKFLNESINKKYLAFIGFVAIIFIGYFCSKPFQFYEVYFQYIPIRLLFPALSIFLSWKYFNNKNQILYFISFVVYAIAILWNIDTGLIVFLSWIAVLIYQELTKNLGIKTVKNILKHVFCGLTILISIFILYSLAMKFNYGYFPDYKKLLCYQEIFYKYGFYMLPMKFIHPWNLVILSYISGLGLSVKYLFTHKANPIDKSVFYLSVLGLGIFSYYQGRSHDFNLLPVCYPSLLLIVIYIDKILSLNFGQKTEQFIRFIIILPLSLLIFLNLAFVFEYPMIISFIKEKFITIIDKKPTNIIKNIGFMKSNIKPKEKVLILSYHSGTYYSETKADNPLKSPGILELCTKEDYQKIYNFLNNDRSSKIIIDNTFIMQYPSEFKNKIIEILLEKRNIKKISPNKQIMIY